MHLDRTQGTSSRDSISERERASESTPARAEASSRVRMLDNPTPVYLLDLSELKEPEYVATLAHFRLFVETHGLKEALLIVDVSHTTATPAILRGLKDTAVQTARCFRARAVVGVKPIQMILVHAVSSFARLHLEACKDRSSAVEWLQNQKRN